MLIPVEINWDIGFVVFTSWRLYIVTMGILSLVEFFVFLYFPESPKYLMSVGKKKEALEILSNIYAMNTGDDPDNYPVRIYTSMVTQRDEICPKHSFNRSSF